MKIRTQREINTLWRNAKIDNQIDKFDQDYGRSDGGCQARFTWVAV